MLIKLLQERLFKLRNSQSNASTPAARAALEAEINAIVKKLQGMGA